MGDIFNILVAGVGGQGIVLIGNILREYGMRASFIKNVVGIETRGVSQREGAVTSTARYLIDSRIYSLDQGYSVDELISPTIPINDAHLVLGLEPLETLRNIKYISEAAVVIMNNHRQFPRNVIIGSEKEKKKYPSNAEIIDTLDQFARRTISMDFYELAKIKFNDSIYSNIIILGVGAKEFKEILNKDVILDILNDFFEKDKKNLEAFEIGYNLIN